MKSYNIDLPALLNKYCNEFTIKYKARLEKESKGQSEIEVCTLNIEKLARKKRNP